MKIVGYIRVSTQQQADHGQSLDLQERKIRAMAELQEAELVEIVVDGGQSAKDMNRPGLERVLEMVKLRQVQAVVVLKLDRLTRSVRDLADLLVLFDRCNVSLISVNESLDTGSAAGRLVINIMAAVSQWEREAIGERTKAALAERKAKGLRAGNVPYGFTADSEGFLSQDPSEQRILCWISRYRASGASYRCIAEKLNEKGLRTRKGTIWMHQYIANLAPSEPSDIRPVRDMTENSLGIA